MKGTKIVVDAAKTALVLSGGGARGAYEVGVLGYIREKLPPRARAKVRFDIISGTSVGAIHACYLAATAHDSSGQIHALENIWSHLRFDSVYRFGTRQLWNVLLWSLGMRDRRRMSRGLLPKRLGGFLDTRPLERIVMTMVPWRNISRNVRQGHLTGLSLSATDLQTGHTAVFVECGDAVPPWSRDPFIQLRQTRIMPSHALASAAIPLLFPSVLIGDRYYCDGGLRQNTPLRPALRLGATKVLTIGLHYAPADRQRLPRAPISAREIPNHPAYVLGKVLNAFLEDHIDYDVSRLELTNAILEGGEQAFGSEFYERLNRIVVPVRSAPYRKVRNLLIRPSEHLATVAASISRRRRKPRLQAILDWWMQAFMRMGTGKREADLLSYLLFDGEYAKALIHLGMKDAEARRDELIDFFVS
ncbi:MAG: patatin-like phospholipase family protein [Nitrospirae bacterium]|nr:patatin-like phospholipase family protein [Nitrospirota bacterium]